MDNEKKAQQCKSGNKAAGLKSTLTVGEKLYLTSFGKGNDATLEQQIDTADQFAVTPLAQEPSIHVTETGTTGVGFTSSRPNVKDKPLVADNPLYQGKEKAAATRRDILGLKDALEIKYFGRTFDDNIHIQIIYNILDIEKIIAVYAASISAAISHLSDGNSDVTQGDFIGYLGAQNTYDVFLNPSGTYDYKDPLLTAKERNANSRICKTINNSRKSFEALLETCRLGYFGFSYVPPKKKDNEEDASTQQKQYNRYNGKNKQKKDNGLSDEAEKKRLYHLMAMAGQLRQWSFHGNTQGIRDLWLYHLEDRMDKEFLVTLDYYFDERFNEINENFIEQNKINLAILQEIYSDEEFAEVARLYYDFIVFKSHKNMGFSIKKLREAMLMLDGGEHITAQSMDSVRAKLYKLIDFCIFYRYYKLPDKVEENVSILRAAVTDEEKEDFYAKEAEWLWNRFRGAFIGFCDKIGGWVKQEVDAGQWKDVIRLDDYRRTEKISYFSKLMYAMCFFLDGKEINDLLTTMINKFDNIASFIATANTLAVDVTFTEDYAFFNKDCTVYVDEINCVRNIARMKKPAASAKRGMYRDALHILGVSDGMSEEELDEALEKMLHTDDGDTNFRNFIANNVIESNRFIYVIKFCNPVKARALVNNTEVTKFVLRRMPETQIVRYYDACMAIPAQQATAETMIGELAEMMKNMDFKKFSDVRQKAKTPQENMRKERYKAIIRLYLAVVYQLVKNLVNVNARYVIGFHCLERDAELYGLKMGKKYFTLIDKLLEEGDASRSGYLARNVRMREHIAHDADIAKNLITTTKTTDKETGEIKYKKMKIIGYYRNNVAHLTAVRSCADFIGDIAKVESYFALYHYLMQRLIQSNDLTAEAFPARINPYYASLDKYHTYVKDFVKALNSPLGYNLPRFKNLSIQELFDRNELQPEPKD